MWVVFLSFVMTKDASYDFDAFISYSSKDAGWVRG